MPMPAIGSRRISRHQEIEEEAVGIGRGTKLVIAKNEFAELRVEIGASRDSAVAETLGLRIGVGIEGGVRKSLVAGPEAGAAHLMRIGFARDRFWKVGHPARMKCGS
jgi:hypothetical protein